MTQKKYKIGLALSGGGAKGFAHAGAIAALEEAGVIPDIVAGTSAGAVVGAFYAAGIAPRKICEAFSQHDLWEFMRIAHFHAGLFSPKPTISFLRSSIPIHYLEDLHIPLRVVATDFDHWICRVFDQGELAPRVMASCCVPLCFEPVVIDGIHYLDGGLFKNFPVSIIREECEHVIGINLSKGNFLAEKEHCDTLFEMDEILHYGMFDLQQAFEIFDIGYRYAQEQIRQGALDSWHKKNRQ